MAKKKTNSRSKSGSSKSRSQAEDTSARPMLDEESRNDIIGVVLIASALALGIAVIFEGTGLLGGFTASAMRLGFGIGAYFIPVLLLAWGLTFFVKSFAISEKRVGAGMGLILLSLISMAALAAPVDGFWDSITLETYGGYLGGSLAWVLRSLVGVSISYVLLAALMVIGFIIIGLSISGLLDALSSTFARADTEDTEHSARPRRERAAKTVPLDDLEDEDLPDIARSRPVGRPEPRSRKDHKDPESRKKTLPTPPNTAPSRTEGFELPPLALLTTSTETAAKHRTSDRELKSMAKLIEDTLATFDIPASVKSWIPGPTVTMFEIELARGVKVNRVTALADDLALALAAATVRILAPIPGKSLVGIEVPNERRTTVTLGDILPAASATSGGPLMLGIGKDVSGDSILADLATMPHLLIAGSTGTGKSVCINSLLMSMLVRSTPAEVRLILIDPKRIELSLYNGVPHLYVPVVTEPKEAASALHWAVSEMDRRLKMLQKAGARNIGMFNAIVQEGKGPEGAEEMPYLVIVIDELADLMMVAAKEVEDSICRLAQLARAAGIHLIVATQRPSTDIITGLIKTNITNRIAFAVGSSIDSRVILDQAGAEKLVSLGDMLFGTPAWAKPKRIQGAFVSEGEIGAVVEHLKEQSEPDYHEEILHLKVSSAGGGAGTEGLDDDPLLWEAADIVVTSGMGSTSLLQRRLKVGYARAGRIMDMLEAKGIVGPPDGSKPREVLSDVEDLEGIKAFDRHESEGGE